MARKPARRKTRAPRTTLFQTLRGNFLAGLAVVLPLFLTFYLLWITIGFVDARVVPLIPAHTIQKMYFVAIYSASDLSYFSVSPRWSEPWPRGISAATPCGSAKASSNARRS